jgi:hypothetical protein
MNLYKKVLIVTLMLALIASMGAASVSAQTSESVATPTVQDAAGGDFAKVTTGNSVMADSSIAASGDNSVSTSAPIVSATYKTPTTFNLLASSQSVKANVNVLIKGILRSGSSADTGQPVELWMKSGTGTWYKAATGTTGTGTNAGWVGWYVWTTNPATHTVYYYLYYPGSSLMAAAQSNIVAIKYENIKTTPYYTTLFAYSAKQVVPHGTKATMYTKLLNGQTPLTSQYVFVWKWSGGKFVIVSRIITRTGTEAGWALADYTLKSVGTGMYKFTYFGTSPSGMTSYARSESNAVQMIWT